MFELSFIRSAAAQGLDLSKTPTATLINLFNYLRVDEPQMENWKSSKVALQERIAPMAVAFIERTEAQAADVHTDFQVPEVDRVAELTSIEPDAEAARLDAVADAAEAGEAKETIGSVISQLVMDASLSYDMIVNMIHAQFEDAHTSRRSVASVAARLRKNGVNVPLRRAKGAEE